jgi:microcystin-dependent protein
MMASSFPSSIDSFPDPLANSPLNAPSHSALHQDVNDAVEKVEVKLGLGSSPASGSTAGQVLKSSGSGNTGWSDITASDIDSTGQPAQNILVADGVGGAAWVNGVPVGSLQMFAGSSVPSGWLFCNGDTVSRTLYAGLFAVIGTAFNVGGEAVTDFRLPDMRGRSPIGVGTGSSLTPRALAASAGVETHQISSSNLPLHTHTITHDHAAFTTTGGEGAHVHNIFGNNTGIPAGTNGFGLAMLTLTSGTSNRNSDTAGAHNHSVDVPTFTGNSGDGGFTNTAIDIMNPFLVVNFIIRF